MSDDIITITGNIATDPQSRGPGATPITSFRLASTQRRLDKESGKWVDAHTNWFTVSAYRQLAVHALDSLRTGQRVIVTGRLRIRTWENASGKGTSVDIDADAIGHDLLWGTTAFHKDDNGGGIAQQRPGTQWAVDGSGGAPDWAPPMVTSTEGASVSESEPVTAPDREPAYAGEQTPF